MDLWADPWRVFDFLADGRNDPAWQPDVLGCRAVARAGGVGAIYEQVLQGQAGAALTLRYSIAHHRRPLLLGLESESSRVVQAVSMRLEVVNGDSTRVRLRLHPPLGATRSAPLQRWCQGLVAGLPLIAHALGLGDSDPGAPRSSPGAGRGTAATPMTGP